MNYETLPTIYLSGPMSGKPGYNFYEFQLAATAFRDAGLKVLNPAEWPVYPEGEKSHAWYIKRDLARLQEVLDTGEWVVMVMLPGWENSEGAQEERQYMVAHGRGLRIMDTSRGYTHVIDHILSLITTTAAVNGLETVPPTRQQKLFNLHRELCQKALEIMESKNHDYTSGGGDPYANFRDSVGLDVHPVTGIILRMRDKQQRVKTFIECGKLKVKGEGILDAILDQINYLVLQYGMIQEEADNG